MKILIIGGGVTGLSLAERLSRHHQVVVVEKENYIGGLAATLSRKSLHFDLGSHRLHKNLSPETIKYFEDLLGEKLLKRPRRGKMYLRSRFVAYPINLLDFLKLFSIWEIFQFSLSYLKSRFQPIPSHPNFENVMIKEVGKKLYDVFIKSYARKLWGVSPSSLSVKGTGKRVVKPIPQLLKNIFFRNRDYYFYPKEGIGEIASKLERSVINNGGTVLKNASLQSIRLNHAKAEAVSLLYHDGDSEEIAADYIISTIAIDDLYTAAFNSSLDADLSWRGIRLVYILIDSKPETVSETFYFPTTDFSIGRVSLIEKYSPFLNKDTQGSLLTVEFPCQENDAIWNKPDNDLVELCLKELFSVGLLAPSVKVLESFSTRIPKVYPLYTQGWEESFSKVLKRINSIDNLFTLGRRGLFLHCNIDHCVKQGVDMAEFLLSQNPQKAAWTSKTDEYMDFFVRD